MKILVLTHYYEPEIGAPQRRWSAMVSRWQQAGHQVTVYCPLYSREVKGVYDVLENYNALCRGRFAMKIRCVLGWLLGNIASSLLLIIPSFILVQYYIEYIGPMSGYYVSERLENPVLYIFVFFLPTLLLSVSIFYITNRKIYKIYRKLFLKLLAYIIFLTPSIFLIFKGVVSVY